MTQTSNDHKAPLVVTCVTIICNLSKKCAFIFLIICMGGYVQTKTGFWSLKHFMRSYAWWETHHIIHWRSRCELINDVNEVCIADFWKRFGVFMRYKCQFGKHWKGFVPLAGGSDNLYWRLLASTGPCCVIGYLQEMAFKEWYKSHVCKVRKKC